MSDIAPVPATHFLARVVAGAQGLAPSIEPRLPSLFEPVAAQGSPAAWSAEAEARSATRDHRRTDFDADAADEPAREARSASRDDDSTAEHRNPRRARVAADERASLVPARAVALRPADPAAPVEAGIPLASAPISAQPGDNATVLPRTSAVDWTASRMSPSLAREARDGDDVQTPNRADKKVPIHAAALIAKPLRLAPLPAALRAESEGTRERDTRASATPDVHISIGRVEIRAQTPQSRSPPPAREKAPTRLDRYLARGEPRR
ncbi:MAG: hypothetical protein JSS42_08605 [Proteobacteria bacterium]|uniref:hypothetical protein n=1 Tax=Rudaea sp. TaxID=2136325 RepID=UPI0032207CA3|nr:hypothetical protein [Pseudomonadota bacterium]